MNDPGRAPAGISELRLLTHRLHEQRRFYGDILGLEVYELDEHRLGVHAGETRITFTPTDAEPPVYHFAFNIPENQTDAARTWLLERTPLIEQNGEFVFEFPDWQAHGMYFYDAAGNLVEFIARHTLDNAVEGPFTTRDIQCVSEIGLVVSDVRPEVKRIENELGMSPYRGRVSDTFTAMGDEHGLLIVVASGRPWFPTQRRYAAAYPTDVIFRGRGGGRYSIGPQTVTIALET